MESLPYEQKVEILRRLPRDGLLAVAQTSTAMLDAASICGLNVLRLMHETTATALAYGIFKTSEFTDDPVNVCFVDVGHSSMQVCLSLIHI